MTWQLFVDRGGTFTDVVARHADGRQRLGKLLSATEDAVARFAAGLADDGPGATVAGLRLGTTVATNALLERRGERVLLLTTRGFADLLEIADQERPEIFALSIAKRGLLHAAVVEIDERVGADGRVLTALDEDAVRAAVAGWDHVCVLFLHSWIEPAHELRAGELARAAGVAHVTLSHAVAPEIGAVRRGDTAAADAYLTPRLRRSVERAAAAVPGARVFCMQSSGGLVDVAGFRGKDAVLSGPAGGVVAARHAAALAGFERVIGFDMGGTSTDVCRCDGAYERVAETVVAGVRLRTPMLHIVTVASGGGSLLSECDGRFQVGPRSAGADPGPACYGRGGPATLTDANLVLGRLRPECFPHLTLDVEAARGRLAAFGDPLEAARGFVAVAVADMAAAIRRISVARGYDPRDYALCAFGGAGGQHACAVARELGVRDVVVHPLAGLLSAHGLSLADVTHHEARAVPDPASCTAPEFPLEAAAAALARQGLTDVELQLSVDVRYAGSDTTLEVPWTDPTPATSDDGRRSDTSGAGPMDGPSDPRKDWRTRFEERHRATFGFAREGHPVELVTARVLAISRAALAPREAEPVDEHVAAPDPSLPQLGEALPVYRRDTLSPGATLAGPALIVEDHATVLVEAGWRARVDGQRQLLLHDERPQHVLRVGTERDPVTLEVMSHLFMSVAEQMGEHLRRVAHSTNIKERLDFSCALFDAEGRLVANAPHIPVHLGAMGETVRHIRGSVEVRPGDAWLANDPYHGGSHLPDLTVVSPVFVDGALFAWVANRGHHADVGGAVPGSMPAHSTTLAEEGAVFSAFPLLRDGVLAADEVLAVFAAAGARDPRERLSDLSAQVACNTEGMRRLEELCARHGADVLTVWMAHVLDNGAEVMADVVSRLTPGRFTDQLDDGSTVAVSIDVADGRARVDFSGTSPAVAGNRNAPRAVTQAAVLYVFRTLAAREIPLNDGCRRVLDVVIPAGSLLDPPPGHAVVGGNVETSQRVVDVLYGALGVLAASQGTMNNLTFGDDGFGYYETICGGAGAGLGFDGASAVHTHMTNTRITDVEVLEQRHPVRVRRFGVRRGTGGDGVWRGGDGVERVLDFLRPLDVSLLAERRATSPFGLHGAGPGERGEQELSEHGVVLRTPGGGGFTPSAEQWAAMDVATARQVFREGRWTGPADGIAVLARRAWVLWLASEDVDAVLATLPSADVLHVGAPGDPWWRDAAGPIDLSRDVPGFEVLRGAIVAVDGLSSIELGTSQVVLVLSDSAPPPHTDVVQTRSAGATLLLAEEP